MINFFIIVEKIVGNVDGNDHKIAYVPLLEDIKSLLQKPDVLAEIISYHDVVKRQNTEECYHDYCDGEIFKQHQLFNCEELTLRIFLYSDAFNVCNPIGAYRNRHKIDAVYYVLGNLPRKFRCSLQHIRLAMLVKTATIKSLGLHKVFEALL